MDVFPQLTSGSIAQYPVRRLRRHRTVVNQAADGYAVRLGDPDDMSFDWDLRLSGLTDGERTAIEDLFHAVEGRLGRFTFLDPFNNLLRWSEDLERTEWQAGPLVQLTPGRPDPTGGSAATEIHVTAATPQGIDQTLGAPAGFQYVWSLWARADSAVSLTMKATASAATHSLVIPLETAWKRYALPVQLASTDESLSFGIELPTGGRADVFGLQVEAQPGASGYKRTGAAGGVHPEARFAEDSLRIITRGINNHELVVHITSLIEGSA